MCTFNFKVEMSETVFGHSKPLYDWYNLNFMVSNLKTSYYGDVQINAMKS